MIFIEEFLALAILSTVGLGAWVGIRYLLSRRPVKTEQMIERQSHEAQFARATRAAEAELAETKKTVDGFEKEAERLQKLLEALEEARERKLSDADDADTKSRDSMKVQAARDALAKRAHALRLEALDMDDEIQDARRAAENGLAAYEEAHALWRQMNDRYRKGQGAGERALADTRLAELRKKLYPGIDTDPGAIAKVNEAVTGLLRDNTVARAQANVAQRLSERARRDPDEEYRTRETE